MSERKPSDVIRVSETHLWSQFRVHETAVWSTQPLHEPWHQFHTGHPVPLHVRRQAALERARELRKRRAP